MDTFKSSFVNNVLESIKQAPPDCGNQFTNYIYAPTYFKVSNLHQTPQIHFRDDVSNQKEVLIKGMDKGLYESKVT